VIADDRDDDIEVHAAGIQHADGRVDREIVVHQSHAWPNPSAATIGPSSSS
jgi:hypothetical protein